MTLLSRLKTVDQHGWKARFFTIWTGQAFSLFGSNLVSFALVWWLTQKTGSAAVLATSTLVAMLPQVFFSPIAGTLVDRWNRKAVMIVADGSIALATLGLVYLFAAGSVQVWHVYVILLIRSFGGAFHWPAMQASVSLMVPKEQLSRIAGLNQMLQGAMNIVAPPLGALLLDAIPMQSVLAIDILTAALAICALMLITVPQPERQHVEGAARSSMMTDFREGLRYVRGWPALLIVLVMAALINFLVTPAFSLLPLLVKKHFEGGALQFGWMNSAWGIGVVLGGATLGVWGGFKKKLYTSMTGLIGMGIGTALIGLAPGNLFPLALVSMFAAGVMNPITNGPLFAILQSNVRPDMQARVITLTGSGATAMSLFGLVIAAPVADLLGLQFWYVIGGVVCSLMGVIGFMLPALKDFEFRSDAVVEPVGLVVDPAISSAADVDIPEIPTISAGLGIEPSMDR